MTISEINYDIQFEPIFSNFTFKGIEILSFKTSSSNKFVLNCAEIKIQKCYVISKSKTIDTGHGKQLLSKIVEVDDAYLKASYMGFDTDTLYIDRYTGIAKVISIYKVEGQKKIEIIESYKCEKVKKLF